MITAIEYIKRVMGWCPNVTQARYRSSQHVDFESIQFQYTVTPLTSGNFTSSSISSPGTFVSVIIVSSGCSLK